VLGQELKGARPCSIHRSRKGRKAELRRRATISGHCNKSLKFPAIQSIPVKTCATFQVRFCEVEMRNIEEKMK
jgi:hypothetical protein